MRKVVGLDISLQKTAVCVLDHDGQLVWQGKVDSEPGPLIDKLRLWHDHALPPAVKASRLGGGCHPPARRQACPRGVRTQASGDHAPHVGLRERVQDRSGEAGIGRRIGGTSSDLPRTTATWTAGLVSPTRPLWTLFEADHAQ
jgi:predicted NBD/HSP70 family sugar kinase